MHKFYTYVLATALFCPAVSFAQSSDPSSGNSGDVQIEESEARKELKKSITRMTYEIGDRRVIYLPPSEQSANPETNVPPKARQPRKNKEKKEKINHDLQVTVQCSPLGEPEAIGTEIKPRKKYKQRGEPVDIKAPKDHEFNAETWRRIAELACLENEI